MSNMVICRMKSGIKIVANYNGREYERRYFCCTEKEAEKEFREYFNLKGKHLKHRRTKCFDDFAVAFNCF